MIYDSPYLLLLSNGKNFLTHLRWLAVLLTSFKWVLGTFQIVKTARQSTCTSNTV